MSCEDRALYHSLLWANAALYLGYGLWATLFNNFAVEEIGFSATQVGLTQSFREVPGLLGFGLGFLALAFSEARLVSLSLVAMGAGVAWTAFVGGLWTMVAATVLMSFGFHYFASASRAVALHRFESGWAAQALGRFGAMQSAATLVAAAAIYILVKDTGYRPLYLWTGVAVALIGAAGLFKKDGDGGNALREKPNLSLKKEYWLYYLLTFFDGCRRHMFTTFAIFLLVKEFKTPVHVVAALHFAGYGVTALTNWAGVGWLINRLGERKLLMWNYLILVFLFAGYILVRDVRVLYGLFIVDGALFGLSIAITTYLQKIAPRGDITGNVSAGQSINHIAAVAIPFAGGVVWDLYDYRLTFLAGLVLVVVSFALSARIRIPEKPAPVCVPPVVGEST